MHPFARLAPRTAGTRAAVVGLLLALVFALRVAGVSEPGLLFVVAVLVAAWWLGPWGGAGAALASAGLYAAARAIRDTGDSLSIVGGSLVRLVVLAAVGYVVGWLFEERARLAVRVEAQERELEELREVQTALAPSEAPRRPALRLASCYVPARSGGSGDFYLVAPAPRDATLIVVGDVAGHGLEAAKRAAFVRATLATAAPYVDDPCRLLELANTALLERVQVGEELVTAACMVFSPGDRTLRWALAGHPPPLWLDCGTQLNCMRPAFPLGMGWDIECEGRAQPVEPGRGLVVYTDGLSEARRPGGELFGTDRIRALLGDLRGEPPERVVDTLRAAAEEFSGGRLPDDLCMVALRVT
ncbi:MAG: serine/threonine-protein phosphatase [Thermoleophilaceae bacterium]|nr:serine/threonine-protein phosphatase [Thermoleophilaceae bacterium]